MKNKVQAEATTAETTKSVRAMMLSEIESFRRGDTTAVRLNTISKATAQALWTYKIEWDDARLKYLTGRMDGPSTLPVAL